MQYRRCDQNVELAHHVEQLLPLLRGIILPGTLMVRGQNGLGAERFRSRDAVLLLHAAPSGDQLLELLQGDQLLGFDGGLFLGMGLPVGYFCNAVVDDGANRADVPSTRQLGKNLRVGGSQFMVQLIWQPLRGEELLWLHGFQLQQK